ncbi:MAG: preprotein translocase subunit SecE [Bacteroidota bacterium]
MENIKLFVTESVREILHKVTWPTYEALQRNSALVLIASFVFAVVIGLIDMAFRNLVGWVYST